MLPLGVLLFSQQKNSGFVVDVDVGCLWILRLKPKQRFTSNAFPFPSIQPNSSPHSHAPSSSAAAMSGQAALKNMSFNVRYTALVFVVQSLARAAMHEAA